MKLNDKKTIKGWVLFDWANSAYSLVISTAVFPAYFTAYTPEKIELGGITFTNSALYSFAVSFSFIVIACLSPLLSGIADFSGRRKSFLKLFTIFGALCCSALYFFKAPEQMWLGTTMFILATIGFAGSIVFYDSYLPLIASEDQYNKVSARGYTYGYIGSVLLLIFILAMVQKPEWFGIVDAQMGSRIGFVLVGLWWVGWSQISFRRLPSEIKQKLRSDMIKKGYAQVAHAFNNVMSRPNLKKFLLSYFFISAGVQTVIYLATVFAEKELGFKTAELIVTVLIIQLVAIGGAYLFSNLGTKKGNQFSIMVMIGIWFVICILASVTYGKGMFYVLAGAVGMVLGGIQSLTRASYSMILPSKETETTSYFSFFDVVSKVAVVAGTFLFGIVDSITHNMRYSVLVLGVLFIVAFIFMYQTHIPHKELSDPSIIDE